MLIQRFRTPSAVCCLAALLTGTALLTGCAANSAASSASVAPASEAAPPEAAPGAPPAAEKPAPPPPATSSPPALATSTPVRTPEQALSAASGAQVNVPPPPRAGIEPPDGVWLSDETGTEFYIEKMKRYEGKYKWITDHQINYLGVKVDIVDADDDWFYVKVYRVRDYERSIKRVDPTPEQLAEVAATFSGDTGRSDRLEFRAFDRGLPANGLWRNGFVIADMNGDGHPDIVHSPPRKGGGLPIVFLGDGKGGWQVWRELRYPREYDYGDVAVGDFNGDRHQDLALAIHLRGMRVLVGDGKGRFTEWSDGLDYQVPGEGGDSSGFSSRAVRVVDWNGDGRLDVLALAEGPRIGNPSAEQRRREGLGAIAFVAEGPMVFLNQGNGQWVKQAEPANLQGIFGDDVEIGDFNADGRVDFATSSSRMSRKDLVNLGGPGIEWKAEAIGSVRSNAYVRGISVADVDHDGKDDLFVSFVCYELGIWRSGIDLLYSRPDGAWERKSLFAREDRTAFYGMAAGDLDADGAVDVVAVDNDGGMLVLLGDGKGGFAVEESPELNRLRGMCRGYRVELADLDGDGRDEVVANYADEPSALFDPQRCLNGGGVVAVTSVARAGAGR